MTFYNITPDMTLEEQERIAFKSAEYFIVADMSKPRAERRKRFRDFDQAAKYLWEGDRRLIYACGDGDFPWSVHLSTTRGLRCASRIILAAQAFQFIE